MTADREAEIREDMQRIVESSTLGTPADSAAKTALLLLARLAAKDEALRAAVRALENGRKAPGEDGRPVTFQGWRDQCDAAISAGLAALAVPATEEGT